MTDNDSAVPGLPPGFRGSRTNIGYEGDTSAGGREAVGSVTGEGGDPTADWRDFALCREVDTEIFFPERGNVAEAGR